MNLFTTLRGLFVLVLVPLLVGIVSIAAIVMVFLFRRSAESVQFLPHFMGRIIAWFGGVSVEMTGIEKLDRSRPYIFAANHQSQFDIFVLQGYLDFDYRWLAKKELFKVPIFGYAMRCSGYISVDRSHGRRAVKSLDEAAQRIKSGASVVVFPEGTRSLDGHLQPFKAGTMVLAIKAGVPVVPLAIVGTHEVLPKGKLLAKPGKVRILVGEPIETSGYTLKQKHELAELLHEKVAELMEKQ